MTAPDLGTAWALVSCNGHIERVYIGETERVAWIEYADEAIGSGASAKEAKRDLGALGFRMVQVSLVPVEPFSAVMDDLRESMKDGWTKGTVQEMMHDLRGDDSATPEKEGGG